MTRRDPRRAKRRLRQKHLPRRSDSCLPFWRITLVWTRPSSSPSCVLPPARRQVRRTRFGAGKLADMKQKGVRESYKLKRQVVISATEAAEMILRVDDILKCAPRRREAH